MKDGAPGLGYAADRLWRMVWPKVTVTKPAQGIRFESDVAVPMRDGVRLRINVFRPAREGRFPVLISAHPYGKDALPQRAPWAPTAISRYRGMRTPERVTFSAYTGWEAPDPSFWVPRGYAVLSADLRGFGTSEGMGSYFSDQEARDYAELIEWAAAQPWSTGMVGLNGVSYLAISQWKVAALRPKSLAAICPWEGFTNFYQDVAYPGGVREDGFVPFWTRLTEVAGRCSYVMREQQLRRPDWDEFWASLIPDLERIQVPALLCASFSDHGQHTRGSFEAFRCIGSTHRFLYTHRGGKWSTYYSQDALAVQARFFDHYLKGEDSGIGAQPRVRIEVRSRGEVIHEVRSESVWPPPDTQWEPWFLAPGELRTVPLDSSTSTSFDLTVGRASFTFLVRDDLELTGPMKLKLWVELSGASDANLFVGVRKFEGNAVVGFEGTSGFGRDTVTKGWLRLAHRRLDSERSVPHHPVHPCDRAEPLAQGQICPVEIELLPSATFFRPGDALRLDVQGRFFWPRNPFFGMFPGAYAPSGPGTLTVHMGGEHDSHLLVPRRK
ncbi:MAG TPA: CocE/NonD family hydrolase [Anaeromyxobacteraceae bacterium]|nr:CocE/NonD family hydrolase [Anaeromyxobacteraceae bacterium]